MFRPASAPCVATACNVLPDAYNEAACDEVISEYCSSIRVGGADPECASQGYGGIPLESQPAHTSCPWAAVSKQCEVNPNP